MKRQDIKEKKHFTEPLIHAALWIGCYLFMILVVKTIGPFKRIDNTLLMPVTFGTIINILLFYGASLILIPRFSENKKTSEFLFSLIVLLALLTVLETVIDKAFFRYYYSSSEESFRAQLILNSVLNIIILSLALGYGFTKNWFRNEKLKQALIKEKMSAELNLLRSQLNPHFLFNVLNMAFSSASRSGDERTADIIEKLSGLMRYTTYESNIEKIDLSKELEYLQNYINLQKMRFSEEMPVEISFMTNGISTGQKISPLILIQFVENAFKHGVKLGNRSNIDISVNIENSILEFRISNPVFVKTDSADISGHGIGIENVKKRLSILYPERHELSIENSEGLFGVKLIMNLD